MIFYLLSTVSNGLKKLALHGSHWIAQLLTVKNIAGVLNHLAAKTNIQLVWHENFLFLFKIMLCAFLARTVSWCLLWLDSLPLELPESIRKFFHLHEHVAITAFLVFLLCLFYRDVHQFVLVAITRRRLALAAARQAVSPSSTASATQPDILRRAGYHPFVLVAVEVVALLSKILGSCLTAVGVGYYLSLVTHWLPESTVSEIFFTKSQLFQLQGWIVLTALLFHLVPLMINQAAEMLLILSLFKMNLPPPPS